MNIQQQTTSQVADTETVMADNEDLDPPTPQDISNMFSATDLLSCSSSDSAKYKRAWLKAKVIRSSILSSGECPAAYSRALFIALKQKENASFMTVTGAILPKQYANAIARHEQNKKYHPMQHQSVINENKYNA